MSNIDDFSNLKRNSKTSLKDYTEEAKKLNTTFQEDERFWSLTTDKAGNGRASIRFLPQTKGEISPFVKYFSHGFKIGTNWYIENCPTTLDGKACPVCEHNSELWASTGEDEKHPLRTVVRNQKRKLHYVSNIFVISDDAKPENNGKVFLFKYGMKIFDKINLAMNPQYKDEPAINPFDFWDGANFILKQRIVEDYPNFDLSSFDPKVTPVADDDEKIKEIWMKQYNLLPFIDEKSFKDYAVLKKRLNRVLGKTATKAAEQELDDETPPFDVTDEPKKASPVAASRPAKPKSTNPDDFFKELMEE